MEARLIILSCSLSTVLESFSVSLWSINEAFCKDPQSCGRIPVQRWMDQDKTVRSVDNKVSAELRLPWAIANQKSLRYKGLGSFGGLSGKSEHSSLTILPLFGWLVCSHSCLYQIVAVNQAFSWAAIYRNSNIYFKLQCLQMLASI